MSEQTDGGQNEIKLKLADCILCWAELECILSVICCRLLGLDKRINDEKLSYFIWGKIKGFQDKRRMLSELIKMYLNQELCTQWYALDRRIDTASLKRNKIAHSSLITINNGNNYIVPFFSLGNSDEEINKNGLTVSDLCSIEKQFQDLKKDIKNFLNIIQDVGTLQA